MAVGAILTQRVAWRNAETSIRRLRQSKLLSAKCIDRAPVEAIAEAVRPALFYNAKAAKLKALAHVVVADWRGSFSALLAQPTDALRHALLGIHGIGSETADVILLYAAKRPTFVADRYALRLFERLGWTSGGTRYETVRATVMAAWPADADDYGELHALIVRHGKERCGARPVCSGCPARRMCLYPKRKGDVG